MNLHDKNITCSFCGKNRTAVKAIVCGPAVYICDECVSFCKEVIDEKFSLVDGEVIDEKFSLVDGFGDGI